MGLIEASIMQASLLVELEFVATYDPLAVVEL
jgi:hypothetical protein